MATKILVCLVMIATASAVPLNRYDFDNENESYQCARQCKGKPSKFNYKTSETYVYEYKAMAETSVAGASEDKAQMFIETHANIEIIDTCEFALRLQNVRVHHYDPYSRSLKAAERSQDFQRALAENTLRFSFDDGVIRDICHPSQEKIWVLNFKRGLLSAFQNSMSEFKDHFIKEIDVSGECDVEYTSSKWSRWSSTKVTKTKNLMACYKHSGLKTFIPIVPYRIASEVQSLPIMDSVHTCEQTISTSKILESSVCKESHVFAPLSNGPSGGSTKIEQTLTFKAVKRGVDTSQDYIDSRSNLLFQHMNGIDEIQNSREAAEQKLKEICEQTKVDIRPETPRLFTELVQIVKVLDSSDLRNLYKMIKGKKLCSQNDKSMKFLLDTLPIAGTPGAVELMVNVINGDDIPEVEKRVWLTSLSLIPDPSEDILPSLVKLISGKFSDNALLPVTALLNTMCKKTVNCDRSYQFRKIVNKINNNIDSSCSSKDLSQLMETLRAIGNVGYGNVFLKTLKTCLNSNYAPLEVKVAAADAYRRFECQENEESGPLFNVFESKDADAELRIMSFLSLMRCPRDSMLQKIAAQLEKEEDLQVGTFVYTHLKNLRQTSDPHKQDIAKAIARFNLKKFEGSGLKTSRCFESSTLLNRVNLGYAADGDLIWSESATAPRALRLNLTVNLFGNSINLFEAGARMDGLEKFVQKYFGNDGYLSQNEASSKDLETFVYARLFGNELFFKHMKGSEEYEKVKSYFNFDKLLENLSKKYNFAYTHSQQLMDHSLIIPTVIGLPVNITVNSSVTVDTRANGKVDFSGILSRSKPIIVTGDIAASAGLEVSGSMMVDAQLYKQGLRMRNTLHSSVSLKSNLMIKGRQIINFEIDSPQQKQELFDARSQFFIIHGNFEKEQDMIKENSRQLKSCTPDTFSKVTGMEMCGELHYPNATTLEEAPYFPLTGPVRATLVMNKKDTQRSYKIFAKWIRNSKKLEAQFQLDTPGSKVDRHIAADVTIGFKENPKVDIVLTSPWKKFVLNGEATINKDLASLAGSVAIDNDIQYKLTSELKMSSKGKSHQYLPFVEIENNGERITLLTGSAVYTEKKDVISNLELKDLNQKFYTFGGRLVFSSQEKRIELSAGRKGQKPYLLRAGSIMKKSGRKNQNIKIDPEFLIQYYKGEVVSLRSNGEFQAKPLKVIGDMTLNTMRIKRPITLKVDVKQKRQSYPVTVKLSTPIVSGDVKGKVNLRKNSYSGDMKLTYRAGSKSDRVSWSGKILDRSKNSYTQYNFNSNLKFKSMPDYNTISSMEITQKRNKNAEAVKNTAELIIYYGKKAKSDKNKVIQVVTSVNTDMKKAEIKADLKAKVPEKNVDIKVEFDHQHSPKKLDSKVKFHLAPFLEEDINADIRIQNKGRSLHAITAVGNLEVYGKKYNLVSDLNQKSQRRYEHYLTLSTSDEDKHTLVTVYKNANNNHQIFTTLDTTKFEEPMSLGLSSAIESPFGFHIFGSLKENNKELYSFDVLSKLERGVAGKWNLELAHPQRKMRARANFNNAKNRITTTASVNWDVASREKLTPEVLMTGTFTHDSQQDSLLLKGNVKFNSPFKNFEKLSTNWNFEKSETDLKSTGKLSWGGIHKQISTGLTATLPISIERTKLSFTAKTPFKSYKDVELEVNHMYNPEVTTTLRGKLDKDQSELILNGKHNINDYSRNIEGVLTLKTPYRWARQVELTVEHSNDENEIKSKLEINKDGRKYSANLLSSLRYDSERSGQLTLTGPERSTQTSFTHKIQNGKRQITTSIDSALKNKRRRYNVDISGHYLDWNDFKVNVDVKSPLKSLKKGGLEIGLQLEDETLESRIIFVQNLGKTGYDIKLKNKDNEKAADILLLLSPLYEKDVYLKSNILYDNYPVTFSSQISWAPSYIIDLTGSYKAQSFDDLSWSLKLTSPFENFENINIVASHDLKNSIRISHLNIDYDLRKMIDVEIRSQNDDEKKLLRIKCKIPGFPFESLDTGLSIDKTRGFFSKADLELLFSQEEKYEGVATLKVSRNDNIRGKLDIKTPIEDYKHIEGSLISEGRKTDKTTLALTKDGEKVLDISVENKNRKDKSSLTVITQGTCFQSVAEKLRDLLEDVDIIPSNLKFRYEIAHKLTTKFVMEEIDGQEIWTVSLNPEFNSGPQEVIFALKQSIESWKDFGINGSLTIDSESLSGKVLVKLSDDINLESMIVFPGKESLGIEFSLSNNEDKLESKGNFNLFSLESSFYFMMTSIHHIEFTSLLKRSRRHLTKVNYSHSGNKENLFICNLVVEDVNGVRAAIDFVSKTSPEHSLDVKVQMPFKDYKKFATMLKYDKTTFSGRLQLNDDTPFTINGIHDNFKNPKFTLKTPFPLLQVLSFDVNGELSDGSSSFTVQFNDHDQIDGNAEWKFDSPSENKIISGFNSNIDGSRMNLKFESQNTAQPRRTSSLLMSLNDVNKIVYTTIIEKDYNDKDKLDFELKLMYPSLALETRELVFVFEGNTEKAKGNIELLDGSGQTLDADIHIDMLSDKKATLTLRKPSDMEYSFTRGSLENMNELYLNWDKSDPNANVVIGATFTDDSTYYKMDKSVSLQFSCPSRSIGLKHSITATKTIFESSGRVYWDNDMDSEVSYQMILKDDSNRIQNSYNGDLKFKLPTRTISVTGSVSDQSSEVQAETTFFWDFDNDATKKIGLKGTRLKGSHTQVDVSLILPKDAHVDSKLVMNKGNTILEGETQIFFSDDSMKTLTLFSKLENNPGYTGYFSSPEDKYNYSIQFGVSHPESRIDIKMVSHLGFDSERLTTAVGLDYLTSRRQIKNTNLFVEINKLKKEINLVSVTPFKSVGYSGAIISTDPPEWMHSITVDDMERHAVHLLIDPNKKRANLDWTNDGTKFSYAAFFQNETALQLHRRQQIDGPEVQDVKILVQLSSPDVLQTTLNWRHGLLEEARDRVFANTENFCTETKELIDDIGESLKKEFKQKFRDISSSIFDDVNSSMKSLEQEITSFENDLNRLELFFEQRFDLCDIEIGDYVPLGKLYKDNVNIRSTLISVKQMLQKSSQKINDLMKLQPGEVYESLMENIESIEEALFTTRLLDIIRDIGDVDREDFNEFWDKVDNFRRAIDPQKLIDKVNNEVEKLKNVKISTLIMNILEEELGLVRYLQEITIFDEFTKKIVESLEEYEIYQIAKQWDIHEMVPDTTEEFIDLAIEVFDTEVSEMLKDLRLLRNPITRFDPKIGILQVEMPLIVSFDRLDRMPSMPDVTGNVMAYIPFYGDNSSSPSSDIVVLYDGLDKSNNNWDI